MEGQWLLVRWSVRYLESRHCLSQQWHLCGLAISHLDTPVFAFSIFSSSAGVFCELSDIPYPARAGFETHRFIGNL